MSLSLTQSYALGIVDQTPRVISDIISCIGVSTTPSIGLVVLKYTFQLDLNGLAVIPSKVGGLACEDGESAKEPNTYRM